MRTSKIAECLILSLTIAASCLPSAADVWQDCTAWYIGGKGAVGAFTNGDMTDIRHAAIADSPTHGGAYRSNKSGVSNLCETVYSAACGRTLENQRTLYLTQTEGVTSKGVPGYKESGVTLPFAATNQFYTLLTRVRLDESQPTNRTWVHVVDLGYKGGDPKRAFAVRYYPAQEALGLVYNGGTGKPIYASPTNDVCRSLRGKWLELSVSLKWVKKTSEDKDSCDMRVGIATEGVARTYNSSNFNFPAGLHFPYNSKIHLGGVGGTSGVSTNACAARASYQMVAYWERVLSDAEILEAFAKSGPINSPSTTPALLQFGDSAWSGEVFNGTIPGESLTLTSDMQSLADFPSQIAAGKALNLLFDVPATCTNLQQIVRLTPFAESSSAQVKVAVDGVEVRPIDVKPGQMATASFPAALFTEGRHTLSLTRIDEGADALKLEKIEISGSLRLGWIDNSYKPFATDNKSSAANVDYVVSDLTTNGWSSLRGTVKSSKSMTLKVSLPSDDVAKRRFYLRAKPYETLSATFDLFLQANGREIFRRTISPNKPYVDSRYSLISCTLPPGTLQAGENAFLFKTEVNAALDPSPSGSWLRFDYFELETGDVPSGGMIILR